MIMHDLKEHTDKLHGWSVDMHGTKNGGHDAYSRGFGSSALTLSDGQPPEEMSRGDENG